MKNMILSMLAILLYIGKAEGQIANVDMVFVKGGTFTMGCVGDERSCFSFSGGTPTHKVTLDDFYISKYPVTQKQWKDVMGKGIRDQRGSGEYALPSDIESPYLVGEGDDYPMYYVSWNDAQEFIKKLNSMTGKKYRLPTEAEWEYAARGGVKSKGYKYAGSNNYDEVAWYKLNCGDRTHPVGTKKPNELGIYDMSGNVSEWVWDWYGEYSSAPQVNPKGPSGGEKRIIRGGSWQLLQTSVYDRLTYWPDIFTNDMSGIGFRLAMPK
ncbi:MAG: formylglycine-generating enzyme family protein [Fibromonadaceae bacterium]|jgi:formylglycine-generating enzyme required for sulfatase activity|nr:formylglycine-generating enzyme family protein [Fibromonadaceae bacterium]